MPPTWDDDFEFDDIDSEKKPAAKKVVRSKEDDFFDDDPQLKLPAIGGRKNGNNNSGGKKELGVKNPDLESKNMGNIYDNDEEYEENMEEKPQIASPPNNKHRNLE